MNATRSIVVAVLALAVAFGLWRVLFPGDEALIRRQLDALAKFASFPANEAPLMKLSNAAKVAGFFTADVELALANWEAGRIELKGREDLRQAAVGARNALTALAVTAENVTVTLGPEADHATVRLSLVVRLAGDPERRVQEVQLALRKREGDWLIHRAATIEYLRD